MGHSTTNGSKETSANAWKFYYTQQALSTHQETRLPLSASWIESWIQPRPQNLARSNNLLRSAAVKNCSAWRVQVIKGKKSSKKNKLLRHAEGTQALEVQMGLREKVYADGSVQKWKAWCTAKGYKQRPGIDYQQKFAPTQRSDIGIIMLILSHRLSWHMRKGDMPTAFLNPKLNINLYTETPE